MKLVSLLGLCGALALMAVGCGDDGRTTTDGGIVLMDSGTGPADSGTPPADSGRPPTDGGGTCAPIQLPGPTAMPCAAATATCAMGATSQAELNACIAADPMAMACEDCLNEASTSCVTMNGCDDEFGAIFCCADDNACGEDLPCIEGNCGAEITAFQNCGNSVGAACGVGPVFAACTPAG